MCTRNGCDIVSIHSSLAPLSNYRTVTSRRANLGNQPQLEMGVARAIDLQGLYSETSKFTKGPGLLDSGAGFSLVTQGWCDRHDLKVVPMVSQFH